MSNENPYEKIHKVLENVDFRIPWIKKIKKIVCKIQGGRAIPNYLKTPEELTEALKLPLDEYVNTQKRELEMKNEELLKDRSKLEDKITDYQEILTEVDQLSKRISKKIPEDLKTHN